MLLREQEIGVQVADGGVKVVAGDGTTTMTTTITRTITRTHSYVLARP